MTDAEHEEFEWDWRAHGRPEQLPPVREDWTTWLIIAGRGWGKTRTGAEAVRDSVVPFGSTPLTAKGSRWIALVGETAADSRDVMVEGESGLLRIHPKETRPMYEPSKRRLTWPNGAQASLYNATEPDQLRGPQQDLAWADELAKWRYAQETWDQLQFGLRLGDHPRQIVTTTPRPIQIIRDLMARDGDDVIVTHGRTLDNSKNLSSVFLKQIQERYAGTRLGRQELDAEILNDVPGALWRRSSIEDYRIGPDKAPEMSRIVVSVDPAVSSHESSNETGIVCAGLGKSQGSPEAYVFDDASGVYSPDAWARQAAALYHRHDADCIVAEKNQGGEMVESVLRSVVPNARIKLVHASRGKVTRAEPSAALYEQGRVHHIGYYPELEDQMCSWVPGMKSPDRIDAGVWLFTELFRFDAQTQQTEETIVSDGTEDEEHQISVI